MASLRFRLCPDGRLRLHRQVDKNAPQELLAAGLPASPGAGVGMLVFTADEAEDLEIGRAHV